MGIRFNSYTFRVEKGLFHGASFGISRFNYKKKAFWTAEDVGVSRSMRELICLNN